MKYLIWLLLWAIVVGIPQLLYRIKGKTFKYENRPLAYVCWFTIGITLSLLYYQSFISEYFRGADAAALILTLAVFFCWALIPRLYKKKTIPEMSLSHKIPKFLEIIFQQVAFLGGLLTFSLSPTFYGIIFFIIHVPLIFLMPRKDAWIFIGGSLLGGIGFAWLQSFGPYGFIGTLSLHVAFYLFFESYQK